MRIRASAKKSPSEITKIHTITNIAEERPGIPSKEPIINILDSDIARIWCVA